MTESETLFTEARLRQDLKDIIIDIIGDDCIRYEQLEVIPFHKTNGNLLNISITENLDVFKQMLLMFNDGGSIYAVYEDSSILLDKRIIRFCTKSSKMMMRIQEQYDMVNRKSNIQDELYTNKDVAMARVFAFRQHDIECNHWYDKELGLPYSYHLQLVADVGSKFLHLLPKEYQTRALIGCYLHDIVEDARMTFNKLRKKFDKDIAYDACKLTTNVGGLDRQERAGDWYYEGIGEHIVTEFIKFCDRIANMEHSLLHGSKQCKMYAKEMDKFLSRLDYFRELDQMRAHLYKLKKLAE